MNAIQITHHDLDGYGASTVAGACRTFDALVHVPRYEDVGPIVERELKRLNKVAEAELVLITDLGLEPVAVKFIRSFAAMNKRRDPASPHRLVILDHHASSLDQLRADHLLPASSEGSLSRFDAGDPAISVLVDTSQSATRMAYAHRALYAEASPEPVKLAGMVDAIDAVDLWRKGAPAFRGGLALDEVFWDNVSLFPSGHPWHDPFVAALLIATAELLQRGLSPAEIEAQIASLRTRVLDDLLAGSPGDDRTLTTRMRVARVLARSEDLFTSLSDGTLLSFGLDAGTFQRVSDLIMESGRASRVANVQRTGTISFRSNNETALVAARAFRGGGHKDAAGGKLPSGSAFSLSDARTQVEPILNPPAPDPASSPFAALARWKG